MLKTFSGWEIMIDEIDFFDRRNRFQKKKKPGEDWDRLKKQKQKPSESPSPPPDAAPPGDEGRPAEPAAD